MKLIILLIIIFSLSITGCETKPAKQPEQEQPEIPQQSLKERQEILDNLPRSYEIDLEERTEP